VDLEDAEREDGRVRLHRFYAPSMAGGSFEFSESREYLKHLGVLDDRDHRQPSVIVPNFMYSHTNCLGNSGFHSICCIDDCEMLMATLEEKLAQPSAPAAVVAATVATMSSESVAAPRGLSAGMLQKLDEIAASHGGSVALHSRSFAQWMHLAFPNECPVPRALLTSEQPMSPIEFQERANKTVVATMEEMSLAAELFSASNSSGREIAGQFGQEAPALLWTEGEEELLSDLLDTSAGWLSRTRSGLRYVAMMAVLVGSVLKIAEMLQSGKATVSAEGRPLGSLGFFGRCAERSMHASEKCHVV